ncbi:MAG: hypothetical protein KatS3mg105_3916 [Gemmatales bacterium]|nr:MAG: hypothetical protein KatS3mg105_3916 [Gemmatales bacterium]
MFRWLRCPGNCWILLAAVLLAASSLRAQTPDDTTFTRQRMFRIPFQTENGARPSQRSATVRIDRPGRDLAFPRQRQTG